MRTYGYFLLAVFSVGVLCANGGGAVTDVERSVPQKPLPASAARITRPEGDGGATSGTGCPLCCCAVKHPPGAGERARLGYCLRSNNETCKKMCESQLMERVAEMDGDAVAKLLEARVPGIHFDGDKIEITEDAVRALVLMIHERDLVMGRFDGKNK